MKQYQLVIILLSSMSMNAFSNPFNLEENFQKLDKEQKVFLVGLREAEEKQEAEKINLSKKTIDEATLEREKAAKEVKAEARRIEKKKRNAQIREAKRIKKEQLKQELVEKNKIITVDINLTHENQIATKKADKAYLDAITDMDKE